MSYIYDLDNMLPLTFKKNGQVVKLGCIYVAASASDARKFDQLGVRYIRFSGEQELLTKHIMYPILIKKFPGLKWDDILGINRPRPIKVTDFTTEVDHDIDEANAMDNDTGVSDVAASTRTFTGCLAELTKTQTDLNTFYGDLENVVDFEMLMRLGMMPRFMNTIMEATLMEADDIYWKEGYNKKLGLYTGLYDDKTQGKNLLIIDCSASIPRPISAALLAMAESLRTKLVADVIFTAGRSYYYRYGDKLPTPQTLRNKLPLGNESHMFNRILFDHVFGHEWDNIVCFGDNDTPGLVGANNYELNGTKIGHIYNMFVPWDPSYASDKEERVPGYIKWAYRYCPPESSEYCQSWVKDFKRK